MARLFVFGIGGTGARVLKSLTMLLASGMRLNDFEMVPIIIDPHKDLPELNDCKSLLKLYAKLNNEIYDKTTDLKEGFFRTKLTTLKSLATDAGLKDDFEFDERHDMPFGQFLELASLDSENPTHDLLSLLYAKETFNKPLSVGFKGNPNVGSVVLNSLKDGPGFKVFQSVFAPDDRIFIVSSIFGGTGAAGFPLLLKNFRNHSKTAIRESQIGALTVMPYFKLSEPQKLKDESNQERMSSDIDSNNFMTKTKAALTYYIRPEFSRLYNALYYIADPDKQNKPYENNEKTQPNKAHLVELVGALSIFNFANTDFTSTGEIYEYCLKKENVSEVDFTNIADETRKLVGKRLSNFYILSKLHSMNKKTPRLPFNRKNKFNELFEKDKTFFDDFGIFMNDHFLKWLNELAKNERRLNPLNITDKNSFHSLIKGFEIEKRFGEGFLSKPFDISQVHFEMAKALTQKESKVLSEINQISQYFSVCYHATNAVINSKIKLTDILNLHVVEGKTNFKDLVDGQELKAMNGKELTVEVKNGAVSINGSKIQARDMEASNGVVHSLDKVIQSN